MNKSNKISFLRQMVELMIVLCLSLMIAEVCVRFYLNYHLVYDIEMAKYSTVFKQDSSDPLIDHLQKPNTSAKLMGVWIHTNADGFRGKDYPVARTYKKRIVFLGDSYLLGWGVKEEDTFHDILEKSLSRIYPTEIINMGMVNYNTEQEVRLFIKKGLKYHPDKVVVFWGINDTRGIVHKSAWGVLRNSDLFVLCWSFSHILAERLDLSRRYQSYYSDLYREDLPGYINALKAFLLLKNVCQKNNILLQVMMVPELHHLVDYPFKKEHRMIESFLMDNGIEVHDLTAFFSNWKDPISLWVSLDDAHPNKIAHQLIARYTFDYIKNNLYAGASLP